MRAGADGYLTKDNDLPTLVAAIGDVAAGRGAHSPELAFACAHDTGPARPGSRRGSGRSCSTTRPG
ncbi:hypothetical protein ACFQ60_41200 [Streptomyces zhihengii]